MSCAMARMNAIVTIGRASWRRVLPYTVRKLTFRRLARISNHAAIPAYRTSDPAAARKFQSKVNGYSVDFATIGFSRSINETGLPFLVRSEERRVGKEC